MLTKWFGTRAPRQPAREERFFRPQLEALEDRLPPSSMNGMGGGNGNGNGSDHVNIHNNIHITNSFNGSTLTNAFNGQNLGLLAVPQSTLQGFLMTLYTQATKISPTAAAAATSLVGAEAVLALDTVQMLQGMSPDISTLESQITTNEATLTTAGDANAVLLGEVAYAVFLQDLVIPSV